jgi:hypothetical protein
MFCPQSEVSQLPATPPRAIAGVYGQREAGSDWVRIARQRDGTFRVALKLYYANGHTCQLNHNGEWKDDHLAVVADGLNPEEPCRLNFFFSGGRILMKDEGLRCAPVYCGTRGKFDEVSLPKASARPQ